MVKEKTKKSKGPQDRNSNYQMKNGNSVSKKKEKKSNVPVSSPAQVETKAAPKAQIEPASQKSFISGLSSSISSATSSLTKMLKH